MNLLNILKKSSKQGEQALSLTKEEMAEMLRISPEMMEKFEAYYQENVLSESSDGTDLFSTNSREAAALRSKAHGQQSAETGNIVDRIVDELLTQAAVYSYDGSEGRVHLFMIEDLSSSPVTNEEIMALPEETRPWLTGSLAKVDCVGHSYEALLGNYKMYKEEQDPKKKAWLYGHFRQGMDILDLDDVTYAMIDQNPNSMGHWLPPLVKALEASGADMKIPKTKVLKVPLTLLQLTRCDYGSLNDTTMKIVNQFCKEVFDLKDDGDYFIKTGTYSSKFDFRNARVTNPEEVNELGEYLLYIHFQALQMASPLAKPVIYGVSTTTEWVVRDYIAPKTPKPTIYKGLPLRTEFRVFIDGDTREVLGIHNYWDPEVMEKRFSEDRDDHDRHDYLTYMAAKPELVRIYEEQKDRVIKETEKILQYLNLPGQWSLDVMYNDGDLWLIDMALADNSAYYKESVPKERWARSEENWIPDMSETRPFPASIGVNKEKSDENS